MPQLLSSFHDSRFLGSADIQKLTLTPDAKYLVAASNSYPEQKLSIFEAESGNLVQDLPVFFKDFDLKLHTNHVTNELFYWSSDGNYGGARKYDVYRVFETNGVFDCEKMPIQFETDGYYPSVVFTEKSIYVATPEGLKVLDAKTYAVQSEIKAPFYDNSNGTAISADGKLVVFGNWQTNEVVVYATETGEKTQTFTVNKLHDSFGAHIQFIGSTYKLLSAADTVFEIWDASAGTQLSKVTCRDIYGSTIMGMELSSDANYLLMLHTGRMLSVYDLQTEEQVWLQSYVDNMNTACFSKNRDFLYVNNGKRILHFQTSNGEKIEQESKGVGSEKIDKMYVLPVENRILAFNSMQALHLNTATGSTEKELFAYNSPTFSYNEYEPEAAKNLLCSGGYGASVGNAVSGKLKSVLTRYYGGLAISSEYMASCHSYFSNESKKLLQAYDLDGKNEFTLAKDLKNIPIKGIKFLKEPHLLAGINEKFAALWDLNTQQQVWISPLKIGNGKLESHEDGTHIFVQTNKHLLICLDAKTGKTLWEFAPRKNKKQKDIEFKSIFGRGNFVLCLMSNGDLKLVHLTDGTIANEMNLCETGSECAALAPDNTLYLVNSNTSWMHYNLKDWLGAGKVVASLDEKSSNQESGAFEIPAENLAENELLNHFKNTNWHTFSVENDGEKLIALLEKIEQEKGITELHQFCSEQLKNRGALKLTHRFGHITDMVAFGLSKDGNYLATGSWVGENYDEGGELMIWDVRTGRCVNNLDRVNGGVGWPEYANCIQWSNDGKQLGLVINTNGVASVAPFADNYEESAAFYETDGWSRPPQWCWHPEDKALFIACWARDVQLPGVVAPLEKGILPLNKPYGFSQKTNLEIFTQEEIEGSDNNHNGDAISPLTNYKNPGWSSKGYLFGCDNNYAFTQNPQTRSLETVIKNIGGNSVWSPDGTHFLNVHDKEIDVYDATGNLQQSINVGLALIGNVLDDTDENAVDSLLEVSVGDDGKPTLLFGRTPVADIDKVYWHPNAALNLFAVAVLGEFGYLAFYQNFELLGIVKTNIFNIGMWQLGDALPLAFSPEGNFAASLSDDRKVKIWEIGKQVTLKTEFAVFENCKGILWGAHERLMGLHDTELYFYDAFSGAVIAHYSTLFDGGEAPSTAHSPLGKYGSNFELNPYFPIAKDGEIAWMAAFEKGLVVCEEALQSQLETELAYSLGNRLHWPYNWAKTTVYTELSDALNDRLFPLAEKSKTALKASLNQVIVKDPADYFLTLTKKELFGKNTKKGKYQLSDNSSDFWNDTKNAMETDVLEIGIKKAKEYKANTLLKGDEITPENLKSLVGKAVLYVESYAPSKTKLGTLTATGESYGSIFHIEFNDDGRQGSSGSSGFGYGDLISIGKAEIR